jgi:phosphohistidine phosphatase
MKQIFLLRHAKSDWDNLNQQDFDRPLAKRGMEDAILMSQHIKEKHYLIDKVLCSSAKRTKQTFDICSDGFNFPINNALYSEDLYFGKCDAIINFIRNLEEDLSSILIIGHNPTMHLLLESLSDEGIKKFPTCSLAEINIENTWKDLSLKKCKLKSFIKPKELKS